MASDFAGLDQLTHDLQAAAAMATPLVSAVVKKAAVNVKKDARTNASGHRYARGLPASISFDVIDDGLTAVVGPDKDIGVGALGTFYEYGSASASPQPFLAPALDAEEPRFVEEIAKAAAGGLLP